MRRPWPERRRWGRLLCVALCVAAAVALPVQAQGFSASEPFPRLPRLGGDLPRIVDLESAPPVARDVIAQLAMLGVYPLTAGGAALPNELLDAVTAAYMIVNAFAPRSAAQYPVPAETAFSILSVIAGSTLSRDDRLDVGTFRDLIVAVLAVESDVAGTVAEALEARYPALRAGNPGAPITRAGAALMVAIALERLEALGA